MSSEYIEAFDSLVSDEEVKSKRVERILAAVGDAQVAEQEKRAKQMRADQNSSDAPKRRKRGFFGRRAIAWVTAAAVFVVAVAISVPVGINLYNNRGLLGAMTLIKDTFVDMNGVAAFGLWNAPDPESSSPRVSQVAAVRDTSRTANDEKTEQNDVDMEDWDDDLYDWESDYDWDPTRANVLISIGENGKINEVVYERTNGRGQVRQSKLGNAAMVYVSDGFTYVMYVDDEEWDWWLNGNFAQEMLYPNGFRCHYERMQTVVIHNATGNVYALKDIISQVNELSGAMNYTMTVQPYKNDFISVCPMYGNGVPQWYNVIYDERTEKIRYELMLSVDAIAERPYDRLYFVRGVRKDRYGQKYLLEGYNNYDNPRVTEGIVELPAYTRYGDAVVFEKANGMMFGSDERVYVFADGKLKVFGEDFRLEAVETDSDVTFEGIANEFFYYGRSNNEGIVYKLSGGYLYSMFGRVWKVDDDGTMREYGKLDGCFPHYADEGWMLGGEIIAFVDTQQFEDYSVNGSIVRIRFENANGTPRAVGTHIIKASEISVQPNNRTVVEQNERPYTNERGDTKYFLITVRDGEINVDYFAYGYNGRLSGLTKPVTEPLVLS